MLTQRIKLFLDGNAGLLASSSLKAYRERLDRFAAFMGDRKVSPLLLKQYVPHLLAEGLSRRSAVAYYAAVQSMFMWLFEAGVISANPVPKLRRFIVPHTEREPMTQEDVDKLLAQARKEGRNQWYYFCLCSWETGLRLSDVATLKWCEVNQTERTIKRVPQKTKRFGKSVEIPISAELLAAMRACPPYAEGNPAYVCPKLAQYYLFDAHQLSGQFLHLSRKAGVNKSAHALRRGFVSRLLNRGVPTAVVRSLTGQSLRVLETYSAVDLETKRAAVA